ncbi:von Willebrand factor A domain-containing protein 5A-like isoform X2 [Ostrea edulis]|uniref:von Willebrand factor A domain-containing protein 5A-like isoform X2 n=1 Tax=Ostrea edulis TaxID=37623 RepID=UPI0024AFF887|nr:von Willebrand factor A domain-containing protein 5A-like isoform X2 [Ostrea edulis]
MTLETIVAGGKNVMVFENKMEYDVFADITENKMSLPKQLKPGSDFSIVLHYKGFEKPGTIFEKGLRDSKNGFLSSGVLMINFSPEFEKLDADLLCEFVFVIDRSGSMNGERIDKAKETLLLLLKSLPINCIFNIVSFGTTFTTLFSKSKPYNEETLEKALELQRNMCADMGGTEIFKPLENIFKNKHSGSYARQVFLLTDGQVSNVSKIVQMVRKQENTRVFTFGIGNGCSTELIRNVAKVSNGKATFVKDKDRLQSKVMSAMRCSLQRGIADVSLTWTIPEGCTVINAPDEVPPVYPGERIILYAIISGDIPKDFSGKPTLMLTGKAGKKNVKFSMEFDMNSCTHADDSCPLHRLAAKSKLTEMELNMADENALVALSTAMNVPCKYTAFVGVDKTATPLTSEDVEMESCSNESFDLSSYNLTSPTSKPKSGFGEKFVEFFSNILPKTMMQSKDADVSTDGSKRMKSASKRPPSSSSPGALHYMAPVFSRLEMLDCSVYSVSDTMMSYESHAMESAMMNSPMDEDHERRDVVKGTGFVKDDNIWKMMQLIEKQKFDGSWQLDNLSSMLNKPEEEIQGSSIVKDTDVWATALAIAFLKKEFPDKKDEWEMIVEKALNWLKTKDTEEKDIVQEAMIFLSA